jgi:hypothetical protein
MTVRHLDRARGPAPNAATASPASSGGATVGSSPRPEHGQTTASTTRPVGPRLRAGQASRRLYARGNPIPWPDAWWHLNSRRVPGPPVPRDGLEHVREIRRRRGLLPMHLRRNPAFDIASPNWDTFSR